MIFRKRYVKHKSYSKIINRDEDVHPSNQLVPSADLQSIRSGISAAPMISAP
jgi:hypothetical protein